MERLIKGVLGEALEPAVGSLGTWTILFCERAWPLPRASCKAGLAREGCKDKCSGGFADPASHYPFLDAARMETYHGLSSSLPCSPFQASLGTTKIWALVSWQHDECAHSFGICFKLSIKISTILGGKNQCSPAVGRVG